MHRSAEQISKKGIKLILKTIGNRKGDCAWSCSRWQTQPEKICKLQSTNQYNVRSEWHWFVRCDLQIFSGCVCHLEQLHAQSPFLFPIVFSINSFSSSCPKTVSRTREVFPTGSTTLLRLQLSRTRDCAHRSRHVGLLLFFCFFFLLERKVPAQSKLKE